jgi:hypothetical protein
MEQNDKAKRKKLIHALDFISQYMDVSESELRQRSKRTELVKARQTFYYIMRKYHYDVPFELIGGFVNYNHATVLHGNKTILNQLATEPRFRAYMGHLETAYAATIKDFKYIEPTHHQIKETDLLKKKIDNHLETLKQISKVVIKISNELEGLNQLINSKL